MQMVVDFSLIVIMFLFAYAFGRKSESDKRVVIPKTVTLNTLFLVLGVMLLLNLPSIISLMQNYGN